jgi:transketolase N-terminal domain/subunit
MSIKVADVVNFLIEIKKDPNLSTIKNPKAGPYSDECVYFDGVSQHCLVGHWIKKNTDVQDEWFVSAEGHSAEVVISMMIEQGIIDDVEKEAAELLSRSQELADSRYYDYESKSEMNRSWGKVVDELYELGYINMLEDGTYFS